jgi:hypothetical protein
VAYFKNSTVNLLNLHYVLHAVAATGGGAFFGVYLLNAGMSAHFVLAAIAGVLLGRFAIRPTILPLGERLGLKALIIAGTLLSSLQYLILPHVSGVGGPLFALLTISAVGDVFYWTSYHAFFAAHGDDALRGHHVGVREALAAPVGVLSPIVTGWALVTLGPQIAFATAAVAMMVSSIPLLFAGNVSVPRHVSGALSFAREGFIMCMADGWQSAGYLVVWQIVLFMTLGDSFVAYGGALALAAIVGAIGGLLLGRWVDRGHGAKLVWVAFGTLGLVLALRAVAVDNPALAVFANALGALATCLVIPVEGTAIYTLAKASPCVLRFSMVTEAGWDLGGASGLFTSAVLIGALHMPFWAAIVPSFAGTAALVALLRRYYAPKVRPASGNSYNSAVS